MLTDQYCTYDLKNINQIHTNITIKNILYCIINYSFDFYEQHFFFVNFSL